MSGSASQLPATADRRRRREALAGAIRQGELTERQRELLMYLLYRVDGLACGPAAVGPTVYADLLVETYAELLATVSGGAR